MCESRNTQQDLSLLSEAHRSRLRETEKEREQRAEEELDETVSRKPKRGGGIHTEKYRDQQRDVRFTVATVQVT